MDLTDEIRKLAYELFIKSGCIPNRDMDNWLEAERIVIERYKTLNLPSTEESEKPKKIPSTKIKTSSKSKKATTSKKESKQAKKEKK